MQKDNAQPLSEAVELEMEAGLKKCNLNMFPYFPVRRLYYSSLAASMLSQLASYQIMQAKVELDIAHSTGDDDGNDEVVEGEGEGEGGKDGLQEGKEVDGGDDDGI